MAPSAVRPTAVAEYCSRLSGGPEEFWSLKGQPPTVAEHRLLMGVPAQLNTRGGLDVFKSKCRPGTHQGGGAQAPECDRRRGAGNSHRDRVGNRQRPGSEDPLQPCQQNIASMDGWSVRRSRLAGKQACGSMHLPATLPGRRLGMPAVAPARPPPHSPAACAPRQMKPPEVPQRWLCQRCC